ncbi:MAG: twin-arginine translocase subunit TatC [Anaerolineales bacterium]|uniref:twin-arginine translocase subunit TatC n=1 Tax=Candidatus Villigracilis proximus TaxID=3140683 RepID=UPI0031367C73|nr:twin-arginine translocase subunit TatC [Anaerolineales bacterium]
MTANVTAEKKDKRKWRDVFRAFGRAHKKASVQLEGSAPLLNHLNELRIRVFKAFLALMIATGISFVFSEQVIGYLATPIGGMSKLVSIELTENIAIFMKVSLLGGFVLAMPIIVYQIMAFILPGLKHNERGWLLVMVPFATLLFAGGVAFTWFVMLPTAIPFLTGFMGITTQVRPENYFEFVTSLMFWIGVCFEMPMIIMFLAKLKFVTAKQLLSGWRYAIVIMAIVAASVTPTVDPVNMGLVMAPLMGLYLISIVLAAIVGRG